MEKDILILRPYVANIMNLSIKKDIVLVASGVLMVFALAFTAYIVLSDLAAITGMDVRPQGTLSEAVEALEHYINNQNRLGLDRVFYDKRHSEAFSEMFFGKDVSIWYGFSDERRIMSQNQIPTHHLPSMEKRKSNELREDAHLTYLIIKEKRYGEDDVLLVAPAVILQRSGDGWVISEMYDFMLIDSDSIEIDDFRLNYLEKELFISLRPRYNPEGAESTAIYNMAQMVDDVEVLHGEDVLCSMGRESIRAHQGDSEMPIKDDVIYNPDRITIDAECDTGSIADLDRNMKHMITIRLNMNGVGKNITYYGNMII